MFLVLFAVPLEVYWWFQPRKLVQRIGHWSTTATLCLKVIVNRLRSLSVLIGFLIILTSMALRETKMAHCCTQLKRVVQLRMAIYRVIRIPTDMSWHVSFAQNSAIFRKYDVTDVPCIWTKITSIWIESSLLFNNGNKNLRTCSINLILDSISSYLEKKTTYLIPEMNNVRLFKGTQDKYIVVIFVMHQMRGVVTLEKKLECYFITIILINVVVSCEPLTNKIKHFWRTCSRN